MSKYVELRRVERKHQLIKPGETEPYLNFILKGVIRKYVMVGKKEITLQLSKEGHIIHSELSFHTQTASECYIEAIEPSTLLSITYDNLQQLYLEFPVVNKLSRLLISDMYVRKDRRDMEHIRLDTKERFLKYMNRHPDMIQRVSQKYIASYLNIKPETFSRLKHLMRKRPVDPAG